MGAAWIPITVVAALSQTVRNALQRSLKGRLSTNGAAFTRFVVVAAAPMGLLVGAASSLGSAGWFTAFTLQIAAYVRTLGLIELPATLLISLYAFRERPSRAEIGGLALLGLSIAMVLLGGR